MPNKSHKKIVQTILYIKVRQKEYEKRLVVFMLYGLPKNFFKPFF